MTVGGAVPFPGRAAHRPTAATVSTTGRDLVSDEQEDRPSGSVPHAFRQELFWHWAPKMPSGLSSSFVTVLYAHGAASNPAGQLKFRDGKAIRISDIAAACKADEKDTRRYMDAAIAAGVLAVEGERGRGKRPLYSVLVHPAPDWQAAVDSLAASKRVRPGRPAPQWRPDDNGGRSPELSTADNGGLPPELQPDAAEEVRGTAPLSSSGDRPPNGSGDRPPNNPGSTKSSHDEAEVVVQPQVDAREEEAPGPDLQALDGGGRGSGRAGQPPLLLAVHEPPPLDHSRIAAHMAALYQVSVPRHIASRTAVAIVADLMLPDPTAYVLAALTADPGRYRPPLPHAAAAPDRRAGTA